MKDKEKEENASNQKFSWLCKTKYIKERESIFNVLGGKNSEYF